MEKFDIHFLGCGSAKPTLRHQPSSQVVNFRDKLFMIDCGEGAQLAFCRAHLKFSRLNHIFISHLHGDHFFGLFGLTATLALMGRTAPLHIYAHAELENFLLNQFGIFARDAAYEICFHPLPKGRETQTIYEDHALTVSTIPLDHAIPACGFLFREKPSLPHIRRDMIDFLQIPLYAINTIKQGAGWTTPDGETYKHEQLVLPPNPPRAYAYCSDTKPCPRNIELLKNLDVLYHEATFTLENKARANQTGHSTAHDAATMAKEAQTRRLIIGHYSSRYDTEEPFLNEAQAIFPETQAATEGMVIHV